MNIGDIIAFRKDLYFEGAVQADWFYMPEKAGKVAENFVFHGKDYFGAEHKAKTIDTISLVSTLAEKLSDRSANPLSLAIADYGTGKSHLAVTLAQLFSGASYMPKTFNAVIENIRKIDADAAKSIWELCSDRNFVLVINGMRDFNLHYEILRAAQKSFMLYGLADDKLRSLSRAIETAGLFFERNKDTQLSLFERSASDYGWNETGDALIFRIRDTLLTDDDTFSIINTVYKQITGKEISWDEGISARSILDMLLSEYCGLNGQFDHVIILFDEFGRYLEYASGSDTGKSGDSALQQIFEASQDSDGSLQVINFIQSDIKTYLVRVDQTRNISRYIGRYDQSDKYHISSNLETVFANLIYRKDKAAFNNVIVKWQMQNEAEWQKIYEQMGKWLTLSGVWGDYALFRKVVVEGIYPLHPLSTFMLTQLSDYLQNRSSMTLVSQYISDVANLDVSKGIPLIMPTTLMEGDLYQEMLSSEMNGKQLSQHCIRFDNILRKNGDKLSSRSLAVLRANLIARILRFKTRDYEDAKAALRLCSGLDAGQLDEELLLLENEYALIGFDEHAGCFDFLEDSRGAHEYKIKKKRIAANWQADCRAMFKTAKVLEIAEASDPQETSFGINHRILTNEWKFTQEILVAEDLTKDLARSCLKSWRESRSASTPKGHLIWVYVGKETPYETLEQLRDVSKFFEDTPIVIMLLNDAEGRLAAALTNYDILDHMEESIRETYARAYADDFSQAEDILHCEFDTLKKERQVITPTGVSKMKKRLQAALTDIFETIYPQAISFNFDGLLTASNNFTGKGSTYFCQIVKMLLSGNISYDAIHDFTSDVRNRIEAVLMEKSAVSWKCISENYAIMPPAETKARAVYEDAADELNEKRMYDCCMFFDTYCYPPYGLSEEAATMMLAVLLANYSYCVRIRYNDKQNSIVRWRDEVIVKDKKLNLDLIKGSRLILIDTNAVEARFQQLFNRMDAETDINAVICLHQNLQKFAEENGVPENMAMNYKLANAKYEKALKAKREWDRHISIVEEQLERENVYNALLALEAIEEIPIYSIFDENGFSYGQEYKDVIHQYTDQARSIVVNDFDNWLESSIHCKSVEAMTQFEKHVRRCSEKLEKFGFTAYAQRVTSKGKNELSKKDEIRSRQELLSDGQKYLEVYKGISRTNLTDIRDMLLKAEALLKRLALYEKSLGKDAKKLHARLDQCVESLTKSKTRIEADMSNIWKDLSSAQNADDIDYILDCIAIVMNYRIPTRDLADFEELQKTLTTFVADLKILRAATDNRASLVSVIEELRMKYSCSEMDFDVITVLEDSITSAEEEINRKELAWRSKYLTLGDKSRNAIHTWKEETRVLPAYLSEATISSVQDLKEEADKLVSQAMIEDVVYYFRKLNDEERRKCIELLLAE